MSKKDSTNRAGEGKYPVDHLFLKVRDVRGLTSHRDTPDNRAKIINGEFGAVMAVFTTTGGHEFPQVLDIADIVAEIKAKKPNE